MLKNYFKIALKVMMRKKFFSFISLFGISFTLMILMLITAFLDTELGKHAPLSQQDKMVFLERLEMRLIEIDTTMHLDSSYQNNQLLVDTSYTYGEDQTSMSASSLGYYFLDKYMRNIEAAEKYSFYSEGHTYDVFINNNKLSLGANYVDGNFWQIFDFNFLAGNPFFQQQVDNQAQVAVITQKAAMDYFGTDKDIVGKELILDRKHIKVVGLVQTPPSNQLFLGTEVYLPLSTINPQRLSSLLFLGGFKAAFLASQASQTAAIKKEILKKTAMVPLPDPNEFNQLKVTVATFVENYAERILYEGDPEKSKRNFMYILGGLLLLFFLLPTLNLVNINVTRILERSSEIGLRKAFGANSRDILYQFVFENVVLTLIGGFIGFVLALLLLYVINSSQVFPETTLSFNYQVFFYSLLICLFFGVLSGLIPAFKMSKIHIVNALKQNIHG